MDSGNSIWVDLASISVILSVKSFRAKTCWASFAIARRFYGIHHAWRQPGRLSLLRPLRPGIPSIYPHIVRPTSDGFADRLTLESVAVTLIIMQHALRS